MQRDSAAIIGDFVREEKNGDEAIHQCLSCGHNKLSVNQGIEDSTKMGLYHCWHCGMSGIDRSGSTFPVFTIHRQQTVAVHADTYEKLLKQAGADTDRPSLAKLLAKRGISKEVVEPFRLSFEPDRSKEADRLAMPMYLGGQPCGYQSWRPSEQLKYKNEGERGVAGTDIEGTCTHVVIAEGMFDAFKIWEVLHDQWRRHTRFVLCTCGSSISPAQISEILGRVPEDAWIHIAFDNDKLTAAVKLYNLLRPYRNVHVSLPPSGLGKDWDDIFKADASWARKFWVMTLKGE